MAQPTLVCEQLALHRHKDTSGADNPPMVLSGLLSRRPDRRHRGNPYDQCASHLLCRPDRLDIILEDHPDEPPAGTSALPTRNDDDTPSASQLDTSGLVEKESEQLSRGMPLTS